MTPTFTALHKELRSNIECNKQVLENSLKVNPDIAYRKVNEIAHFVGSRYHLDLQIHFPDRRKLYMVDTYGKENMGIVFDKHRKQFPISRENIKEKALEIFTASKAEDAYMYEGKEGVRVRIPAGRLEILPGSIHIWCSIDEDGVKDYVDWLFEKVYSYVNNHKSH